MSTEVDRPAHAPPHLLDVTGLPAPVIEGLRTIVASLREQHPAPPPTPARPVETPEEKARRFLAWIQSHGVRVGNVRDGRESINDHRVETNEEWIARLKDFIATETVRSLSIADDRESIYQGCGE